MYNESLRVVIISRIFSRAIKDWIHLPHIARRGQL
jgi:hypothetical protein